DGGGEEMTRKHRKVFLNLFIEE
ncbi:hypothetical protein LCGC14_2490390, partial [marine sediment metagenome]